MGVFLFGMVPAIGLSELNENQKFDSDFIGFIKKQGSEPKSTAPLR